MKTVFQYSFVVTILWLGFVAALSFVKTPARFSLEDVPREYILAVGNKVFHALNTAEMLFGSITLFGLLLGNWPRTCRFVGFALLGILVIQTWLLFGVLDERTLAQIRGEEVTPSNWHGVYVGLEILKVLLLTIFAVLQIKIFNRTSVSRALD